MEELTQNTTGETSKAEIEVAGKEGDILEDNLENILICIEEKKKGKKLNSKSIGLVAYAEPDYYSEFKEENLLKKMPISKRVFLESLESEFNNRLINSRSDKKVKNILVGQEHGSSNAKCHFQCFLDFTDNIRLETGPGKMIVDGKAILFMFQGTKDRNKLINYCKKDGDYEWLYDPITPVLKKCGKIDAFATIVKCRDMMSPNEAMEYLITHESRQVFSSYQNIVKAVGDIVSEKVPDFEWSFPVHLLSDKYNIVHKWFTTYCIGDPARKKALFLFSEKRAMGKTMFAKSLVNHETYYVDFRGTFTNIPGGKIPKLVILDDMRYTGNNIEVWKALVAGEKTAIRDAYVNYRWNYNVPCIITSNSLSLLSYLMGSEEFKTQVVFFEVDEFMGPEGTKPEDLHVMEYQISSDTFKKIEDYNLSKKKERSDQFFNDLTCKSQLAQMLGDVLGKKQKK